ncbi:MAG: putative ABC transporter permease [Peptostreptococcaceae bacterium]|nr:putative ABC transporter permease [Peptostreptococcaceae bacterium]
MEYYLRIYIYFIIYSFLGWVCECLYCSYLDKRIVNRGFVSGPVCPIYGFGALAILKMLTPFTDNVLTVFLAGVLITSAIEYIASYLLEKIFQTTWWDYSNYQYNLNGRICAKNSFLFGLMAVALQFYVHPLILMWVDTVSVRAMTITAVTFTIAFSIDFSETVFTILRLNNKLKTLDEIKAEALAKYSDFGQDFGVDAILKKIKELPQQSAISLNNGMEEILTRFKMKLLEIKFSERRLLRAFPKMRNLSNPYIQAIREFLDERRNS